MDIARTEFEKKAFKCRELERLMKEEDYGFAPNKLQVLALEHVETTGDLVKQWGAMNAKVPSIGDVHWASHTSTWRASANIWNGFASIKAFTWIW